MNSKRVFLTQVCVASVFAADLANNAFAVEPQVAPEIQFQIIEQKRIQTGGRAIIFNRVAPPILPTAPTTAAIAPVETQIQLDQKPYVFTLLSATVYDRQVTELQWFGDGKTYHVFSNIDFNYIAGIGQFETTDAIYSLILGFGNETREVLAAANIEAAARGMPQKLLPDLGQFPEGYSSYFVAADSATDAVGFAALDAIHAYYDENREQLQRAYEAREAARIEQERLRAAQPAKPKDTVIYFWPKKSAIYRGEDGSKEK